MTSLRSAWARMKARALQRGHVPSSTVFPYCPPYTRCEFTQSGYTSGVIAYDHACSLCPLGQQPELQTICVPGSGSQKSKAMIIGEAPGANEDTLGVPFVGEAGSLLDNALVRAGTNRDEVFVTNAVKCRPPGNRTPEDGEIEACAHYLRMEDVAVKPAVMLLLGNTALYSVLGIRGGITKWNGRWQEYGDLLVLPCLHPAYVKRTQAYDLFYATVQDFVKVWRYRLDHGFQDTAKVAGTRPLDA